MRERFEAEEEARTVENSYVLKPEERLFQFALAAVPN
jgi:hypothetical protein